MVYLSFDDNIASLFVNEACELCGAWPANASTGGSCSTGNVQFH